MSDSGERPWLRKNPLADRLAERRKKENEKMVIAAVTILFIICITITFSTPVMLYIVQHWNYVP